MSVTGPDRSKMNGMAQPCDFSPFLVTSGKICKQVLIIRSYSYPFQTKQGILVTIAQFPQGAIFVFLWVWSVFCTVTFLPDTSVVFLLWLVGYLQLSVLHRIPIWQWCESFVFYGMILGSDFRYKSFYNACSPLRSKRASGRKNDSQLVMRN